jgi:NAD(P)-dependent dehydrogenase (short-subunit alcohol dehydrogenase family)
MTTTLSETAETTAPHAQVATAQPSPAGNIYWQISAHMPRAALVTGGAKRLGRAIAFALRDAGFSVAVHCNSSVEAAELTARDIRSHGVKAIVLRADLADETQVRRLVPEAIAALGPLGVVVNNASTFERDDWDDATRESWDAHIEPNLRAPFVLMQDFARALPADAEGCVINLLDQRVWSLTGNFLSYTVSKAALWALTQTMALALAPRIRVNGIGPGPALPSPRQSVEQFSRQEASVPLGRGTNPEEVARLAMMLLALPSVTGQMVAPDGGQHLQWWPRPAGGEPEE